MEIDLVRVNSHSF